MMLQVMVRTSLLFFTVQLIVLAFVNGTDNKPLILTPLLKEGKHEEAQKLSLVSPDFGGARSYTGFFHVNETCGNYIFFWFFPAQRNWENAPVLLWVNREFPFSVLTQMFKYVGPFEYDKWARINNRDYAWNKDTNLIFLEIVAGNGFSYSEKGCSLTGLEPISKDSYSAVVQFFQMFPTLQENKLFIVGINFAAHFATAIAREIDNCNTNTDVKLNLVGVIIGDPYLDMRCQKLADYKYQLGIFDDRVRNIYVNHEKNITSKIDAEDYAGAAEVVEADPGIDDGLSSLFNIMKNDQAYTDYKLYIRNFKIREQIHVGNAKFKLSNSQMIDSFRNASFKPINSWLEDILKNGKYIVGFFVGQLDGYNPSTSVSCVLEKLDWPSCKEYKAANRSLWYDGDRLAGWDKVTGTVWEVVVRDCGLESTVDQPRAVYNLLMAAIADTPGNKLLTKLSTKPPGVN